MSASNNDSQNLLLEILATQARTIEVQAQTIDRLQQMVLEPADPDDMPDGSRATFLDGSPRC